MDRIKEVCDILDSGVSRQTTASPESKIRTDAAIVTEGINKRSYASEEVEVEDYIKHLRALRDSDSIRDARSVLPKEQQRLESQQAPHNLRDLYDRIQSYPLSKWAHKPDALSALQCARHGWKLSDMDFLYCVSCKQILHIPSDTSKLRGDEWVKKLTQNIETKGHLATCPWTKLPSPVDLIAIPKGPELMSLFQDAFRKLTVLQSLPDLSEANSAAVSNLACEWLEEKVLDKGSSAADESVKKKIFYVINGWTVSDNQESLACQLCLRQVPLWMFISPVRPTRRLSSLMPKEFCPVTNHWSWCPWRLCIENAKRNAELSDQNSELEPATYERTLDLLKKEWENGLITYDPTMRGSGLISSVISLMNSCVSNKSGSNAQIPGAAAGKIISPGGPTTLLEVEAEMNSKFQDQIPLLNSGAAMRSNYGDMPPKKRIKRGMFDTD